MTNKRKSICPMGVSWVYIIAALFVMVFACFTKNAVTLKIGMCLWTLSVVCVILSLSYDYSKDTQSLFLDLVTITICAPCILLFYIVKLVSKLTKVGEREIKEDKYYYEEEDYYE